MVVFVFRYIGYLFKEVKDKSKLNELYKLVYAGLQRMMLLDPVRKVPVYDKHLIRPQTDFSLTRVTDDVFVPLFIDCSSALQNFYYHKVYLVPHHIAELLHLYIKVFNKYPKDKKVVS